MLRLHLTLRSYGTGARRIGDNRVLALVKAFLKAGILGEDQAERDSSTGCPQGGILSPLLSNVALSALDGHIAQAAGGPASKHWERSKRRQQGRPNYRLVRYADDWCLMISGTKGDAQALRGQIAEVLSTVGLRLSPEKTLITHIDEGLDFLGFRIQRHQKKGAVKRYVCTYPHRAAVAAVKAKVRALTQGNTHLPLAVPLHRLNQVLRGWTTYFRHAASAKTFACLGAFTWRRVWLWLRHKHRRSSWKELRRLYAPTGGPAQGKARLFNPATVSIIRYRYRGAGIPSPWTRPGQEAAA